jgi:dienelactone hydrolase
MKISCIGFLVSIIVSLAFSNTQAQQVFKTTPTSVIAYLEYVPADYDGNSNKYPIVIFLHGIGERGPNTTDITQLSQSVNTVTTHGPPKHVKNGTEFPFILISPQLKNNYSTWPSSYVKEVIDYCMTYLRVDERRIYVTGLSLGGGGAWVAVQDLPEFFAAVAPVCGGYNSTTKACGIAAENLPVWAFHGDKDTVVPLSRTTSMVNAINACTPTPSPLAKLTVYAGVGHNAWDYAYKTDNSLHTPNVYQWLLSFTNTTNKGNKIPIANAGIDKTITVKSTTLTGSGTDSDGSISSYIWRKMSGPAAILSNETTSTLSLAGLVIGTYVFSLQIKDNSGNSDTDYIKVMVENAPPVADAGVDKTLTLPSNSILLTGTATDSDGTIASYEWTKVSGGAATFSNALTSTLTVTGLAEGTYVFRLTAKDNLSASAIDDVTVTVSPAVAPIVNAGTDKIVKLPTSSATISGTATATSGNITGYLWTKISGGSCTMSYTTTSTLKLSGLASGIYVFRLKATASTGSSSYDEVKVTVDAPPVVNAGADKSISLPLATALVLTGSATDSDGTISKYLWSKYSGPNVTVSNTTTPSLTVSKVYEGTYVFKLAVTDNVGVTSYDYVSVVVSSTSTSGRMTTSTALVEPQDIDLESDEIDYTGMKMILFNDAGKQIFAGDWSKEKESELVTGGLYFYNLVKDGIKVKSGKIFRKNS